MAKADLSEYLGLVSGEAEVPSRLFAVLPPDMEAPGISEIANRVNAFGNLADFCPRPDRGGPGGQWHATLRLEWEDVGEREYELWLEHKSELSEYHFERRGFSEDAKETATLSTWAVGVETQFGDDILTDFHNQLKVLDGLGLDPPAVLDAPACTLHPGAWVREAARAKTPPAPMNLFTIHAVYDEDVEESPVWLHTHGLLRCHSIEWEMLEVNHEFASSMGSLINVIAISVLSQGCPAPDDDFEPATGMRLVWLPFEDGIGKFSRKALGGRDDRDEYHCHPSGVLLARRGWWVFRRYRTPNDYGEYLGDNPLLGISSEETRRMAELARERFDAFAQYFATYSSAEDWAFLVKLGYAVDGAESDEDREHMWFEVHGLDVENGRVEATLVNEPYHIARMSEGDRDWHDLDLLTDWSVVCCHGMFSPDKISLLETEMAEARDDA